MKLFCFSLFCLLIVASEARTFQLCELFYYLRILGLDNYRNVPLSHFVCAADYSSKLDTFYYENTRGTPRYGIFQISGLEWCNNGRHKSPNKCNTSCDSEYLSSLPFAADKCGRPKKYITTGIKWVSHSNIFQHVIYLLICECDLWYIGKNN
uniref:Lysozyme n=1 Tax=Anolis carolinensis TaxID=28377 RepID=A0A803STQ7_ANOCA